MAYRRETVLLDKKWMGFNCLYYVHKLGPCAADSTHPASLPAELAGRCFLKLLNSTSNILFEDIRIGCVQPARFEAAFDSFGISFDDARV